MFSISRVLLAIVLVLSSSTWWFKHSYDKVIQTLRVERETSHRLSMELLQAKESLKHQIDREVVLNEEVDALNKSVDSAVGVYLSSVRLLDKCNTSYVKTTNSTVKGNNSVGGFNNKANETGVTNKANEIGNPALSDSVIGLLDKAYSELYPHP